MLKVCDKHSMLQLYAQNGDVQITVFYYDAKRKNFVRTKNGRKRMKMYRRCIATFSPTNIELRYDLTWCTERFKMIKNKYKF